MLYLSHLIPDDEMAVLLDEYHLGVESIEFSIGYCLDEWRERVSVYRERLDQMGVGMGTHRPLSVHGPFLDLDPVSWDSKIAQATLERFTQAYEAAVVLGAEKIVYHTCFVPMINFLEGWTERMIRFWREFMEGRGDGISVCLENVFDPGYAPLGEIVRGVDHPAFGLCLDIGHANCFSPYPAEEWLRELCPYIRHLHLHDNHGKQDEHLGIGQGELPWESIFQFMREEMPGADAAIENPSVSACRASLAALGEMGIAGLFG